MRLVLDTNVLISALFKQASTSAQILELWRQDKVELLVSSATLAEISRVLTYPKVQKRLIYTSSEVEAFLRLLNASGTMLQPRPIPRLVEADPNDDKFIALALFGQADYLVSGDSHLLEIGTVGPLAILTPRQFLDIWQASIDLQS